MEKNCKKSPVRTRIGRHRFQGCSALCCLRGKPGMIRAVSEGFSGYQLCFRENQRWNSTDSALIFLLWKFPVSELFQRKSALFSSESALFQRKSALFQRWFLALKISVFSAVQSWISAVQRFSGNEQRWNRPESILNQSWSALNVSETSTRIRFGIKPKAMYVMLKVQSHIMYETDAHSVMVFCLNCF